MPEKTLKSIRQFSIYLLYTVLFTAYFGCQQRATNSDLSVHPYTTETAVQKAEDTTQIDTVQAPEEKVLTLEEAVLMEPADQNFKITEDNAIEFFFQYQKKVREQKVRLETSYGNIVIELFDEVPYHKSNFIYLTKKGYFDETYFHRIVKGFIIQGGNADHGGIAKKRKEIGRYLLPPVTDKGFKHHRGIVSMPSSDINNPHQLASPYEFFIVVTKPGSYHLDAGYTPFGKVVEGMDVVDKINAVEVESGDWPLQNIVIRKAVAY
jgi:cyclophilin family peptidyl-prolyl cis-trans isomerase